MKNKEELNALKEEYESLSRKLAELTEDELRQVSGGAPNNGVILVCSDGKYRCNAPGCGRTFDTSEEMLAHAQEHFNVVEMNKYELV